MQKCEGEGTLAQSAKREVDAKGEKMIDANQALVKISAARKAIAEAKSIDEVKDIRDKAEAVRTYAKQAGLSQDIVNDAAEIKIRAEYKAGQLLREMEKNKGAKGQLRGKDSSGGHTMLPPEDNTPKLSDLGVSKNESSRWQMLATIPAEDFEEKLRDERVAVRELTTNGMLRQAKANQHPTQVVVRGNQRPCGVVYADPPWEYEFSETKNREIGNKYPTATVAEIISHAPATLDNCVLFLWATAPKLLEALEVMHGWGFEYKTCAVWDKEIIGMGYWFRGQHELLLVGVKGNVSPPNPELRVSSIFRERRGAHSAKPACVAEWIESAFPDSEKLEMYCRSPRPGWSTWGNE